VTAKDDKFKKHPIQLVGLNVLELSLKVNPEVDSENEMEEGGFTLNVSHSDYDEKESSIAVKVSAVIGSSDGKAPFDLFVELLGVFKVNAEKFPLVHLSDWASSNAPLILYPYLREHVYGLTTRCGFSPPLLPLLEVPTIRVQEKAPD
jgi:preprotein translocase subunit SecB